MNHSSMEFILYLLTACLPSAILVILGSGINAIMLSHANKLKKQNRIKILAPYVNGDATESDGGLKGWLELGDQHPDFIYAV